MKLQKPLKSLCLALATLMAQPASAYTVPARMQWWYEARFGMFIHFGSYSELGHGEWAFFYENWSKPAYQTQVSSNFNPRRFDAKAIVGLAKTAGMKYLVITAKHHEGFSMWNSDVTGFSDTIGTTSYNLYDYTPFKRDILAELKSECDAQGIKFCLYYSILDWCHSSQTVNHSTTFTNMASMSARTAYIADMKAQLAELITKYNPAILWFDGDWCDNLANPTLQHWWNSADGQDLYNYLLGLKPDLIINERVKRNCGIGDYECPEQTVPAAPLSRPWETNTTMNGAWGYDSSKEQSYKSSASLIQEMANVVSRDGNYLLNIGPKDDGSVTNGSKSILNDFGAWMATYKDSIYGAAGSPYGAEPSWGRFTAKPGVLYAHVFNWPANGQLQIPKLTNTITRIYSMKTPATSLSYTVTSNSINITVPSSAPNSADSVIAIEVVGTPTGAPSSAIANGVYTLTAQNSGKVAGIVGNSTATGAAVEQRTDTGINAQDWTLTDLNNGYYKIINRNSGLSLDISGASTADGASAIQWTYTGSNNQQWQLVDAGGGNYKIVARHSGKALGVRSASTADGALFEQQTYTGGSSQLFSLAP